MNTTHSRFRAPLTAAALLLAIGACAPQQPVPPPPQAVAALQPEDEPDTVLVHVEPGRVYPSETVETIQVAHLRKIPCPGGTGESRSEMIGPQGGSIVLNAGHRLDVPAGAVQTATRFTVIDVEHPRHLVVRASGPGGQRYQPPVTLTISHQRCPDAQQAQMQVEPGQRRLYMLRERLGRPSEDVGAEPVPDQRALRANLDRLSRYVLASD